MMFELLAAAALFAHGLQIHKEMNIVLISIEELP
jgi:hypothetical protein